MIIYKTFKTPLAFYVYDRNTNTILRINQEEYNNLKKAENNSNDIQPKLLEKFQVKGYLKEDVVEKIEHPQLPILEHYLNHRISQLVLQVTQKCNLRCSYCVYSGTYENRVHSNAEMDFETAKRAIDFHHEHSDELDEVTVGFYGGEPLLRLDLIKDCVNYISNKIEGKKISYSITTNGTLLDYDTMKFLIDNNFNVLVSLDGPKKEHDENRKFANGKGSFDTIMNNISRIKQYNPDFIKKISFNTVINPKHNYTCIKNYFETDEVISDVDVAMNVVETLKSKENIVFQDMFYIARAYDYFKLLLALIKKIDMKYVTKLLRVQQVSINERYKNLKDTTSIGKVVHHGGPCIPGSRKLFVSATGEFYPCERVSESSKIMNIGDIDRGIDLVKSRKILNIGELTKDNCRKCWALPNCMMCVAMADGGNMLSKKKKLFHCRESISEVLYNLKELCMLQEFGYNFIEEV